MKSVRLPLILLALLIAAFVVGLKCLPVSGVNGGLVFHQTATGWQKKPSPKGYMETLRVSSGGTPWALTARPSGLSRWDGAAWQYNQETDLGPEAVDFTHDFALDGEQVWMVTEKGALHWDGRQWHSDHKVTAGPGASIVAGGGEVWVIDGGGKYSHFDGTRWQSEPLVLPAVKWARDEDADDPKLARTEDGSVWLAYQGLWRYEEASWVRVLDQEVVLLGNGSGRLWFSDLHGLQSVSSEGKHITAYPSVKLVFQAAPAGNRTVFTSTKKILEFDGAQWRELALPGEAMGPMHGIGAASDGRLWMTAGPSPVMFRRLLYAMMLLPLLIIAVFCWLSWLGRKRQREQHRLVAQAVQHATGEVPEELEAGAQKLNFGSPFLWIATGVAYFILRMIWPQAPYWSAPANGLAIHLAITFRRSLVKRRPNPSDPIGPGAPSRYDWSKTWKAVAGSAALLLVINLDRLPMFHFLRGYWLFAVVLVPAFYHGFAGGLLNRALRRGDYDGALKVIRWSHFYNPSGIGAFRLSGHVLLAAGRYREADDTLRRSLASSQAGESYGSALEFLGDTLLEQGRYDEALRSYQAALQAFPWRRRPYRGMAEMLLRRDQNAARALDYVEKIVDFSGLTWRQKKLNGHPQDDYWALKAWALARLGRGSEVAAAIEGAVKNTSKKCSPDLACTHYRAGMAMQAVGNPTAAREHFRLAVQFDPKGRRGTLANAALRETSVWGMVSV